MAMKKKFLGLAMAAAIAIPASSVYATPVISDVNDTTKKLEMDATETGEVTIPVTGTVTDNKGEAPQKIEVELPSKMAFTVDQNSDITETEYTISNKSTNVDIELSVASFSGGLSNSTGSGNGIQVLSEDDFTSTQASNLYRNQVSLKLANTNGTNVVDLGDYRTQPKLGEIKAGTNTVLRLTGQAGEQTSTSSDGSDVDAKGAQDNFSLVFSITKK